MRWPRQYLLSPRPYTGQDIRNIPWENGLILSCHKDLAVFIPPCGGGLLLGDAWQTDPALGTPEEALTELLTGSPAPSDPEVFRMEESWCGRYVLIVGTRVYPDAAGTMSVFMGGGAISGSCALLAEHLGLAETLYTGTPECCWLPGPLTQYPEITRLLPTQICSLADWSLTYRPLTLQRDMDIPADGLTPVITGLFDCSLRNMQQRFPGAQILTAVTGGYDSRVVLAMAVHAGLPVTGITQNFAGIHPQDLSLPKELCRAAGCAHRQIDYDESAFSQSRSDEYDHFTAGLANDTDKRYYARDQFAPLTAPGRQTLLLRGNIWALAFDCLRRALPDGPVLDDLLVRYNARPGSLLARSLEAWLQWTAAHPDDSLSPNDRYYLDQRLGCWLADIETGFDLVDGLKSFNPVNSRLILCLLRRYPEELRLVKSHQTALSCYACPGFSGIPYADPDAAPGGRAARLRLQLRKGLRRLRILGVRRTAAIYLKILRMEKH